MSNSVCIIDNKREYFSCANIIIFHEDKELWQFWRSSLHCKSLIFGGLCFRWCRNLFNNSQCYRLYVHERRQFMSFIHHIQTYSLKYNTMCWSTLQFISIRMWNCRMLRHTEYVTSNILSHCGKRGAINSISVASFEFWILWSCDIL